MGYCSGQGKFQAEIMMIQNEKKPEHTMSTGV